GFAGRGAAATCNRHSAGQRKNADESCQSLVRGVALTSARCHSATFNGIVRGVCVLARGLPAGFVFTWARFLASSSCFFNAAFAASSLFFAFASAALTFFLASAAATRSRFFTL